MRANTVGTCLVVGVAAIALAAVSTSTILGDEPKRPSDKAPTLTLDEKYEKLKGGLLKSREGDVIALLGPAHSMTRPGKPDNADIELRWQYSTRIVVTYKDGKVSEVWGTFSEQLPVAKVTPENLRKVQPGMSEREVVEILGDAYARVKMGGRETGQWGASDEFKVAFAKDGRMVHHERPGNSYLPRK